MERGATDEAAENRSIALFLRVRHIDRLASYFASEGRCSVVSALHRPTVQCALDALCAATHRQTHLAFIWWSYQVDSELEIDELKIDEETRPRSTYHALNSLFACSSLTIGSVVPASDQSFFVRSLCIRRKLYSW